MGLFLGGVIELKGIMCFKMDTLYNYNIIHIYMYLFYCDISLTVLCLVMKDYIMSV